MPRRQPLPIELEVKAAIEKLSPAARNKLTQFARRGAYQLTRAGEPIASDEHDQIVHDAIADTLSLAVPWDRRLKMELHLYNVIFRRVSNGVRSAKKKVRVPLDALDTDEGPEMVGRGREPEAALGRAQVTLLVPRVLRERAAGDPEMLSILDAYNDEVFDRRAVMVLTGLGLPEFINARRRLDRLIAGLPVELRYAALAAMRGMDIAQVSETTSKTIHRDISRQM